MRYRNTTNERLQIHGPVTATVEPGEEFEYPGRLGAPFIEVAAKAETEGNIWLPTTKDT